MGGPSPGANGAAAEVRSYLDRHDLQTPLRKAATAAIEAADAMEKAAEVEVVLTQEIGGGYITVLATGDVGSVQSAIAVGAEAAERVGDVVARHVIPRPAPAAVRLFLS